jgi:hypothetical protein
MPYVQRDGQGRINGIFVNAQPGYAEEWVDGEVSAYQPPPQIMTPLQARRALRAADLLDAVNAWIATQPDDAQEAWEYCIEVRRDSPLIAGAQAGLSLTPEQVDDLFRAGAAL